MQNADSREKKILNFAEISRALKITLVKECKFALNYFAKGFSDTEAQKDWTLFTLINSISFMIV